MFYLHLFSNLAIALSYFAIPFLLLSVIRQIDRHSEIRWLLALGGGFILSCGIGHVLDAFEVPMLETLWCFSATAPISAISAVALRQNLGRLKMIPSDLEQKEVIWQESLSALLLLQWEGHRDLRILQANPEAQRIAYEADPVKPFEPGYTLCESLPGHLHPIKIGDRSICLIDYYLELLKHGQNVTADIKYGDRWYKIRSVPLPDNQLLMAYEENTLQHEFEERLKHEATHDSLTGLLNQHYLNQKIKRGDRSHGLVLIDLTGFKSVNDSKGHSVGNAVLEEVARRLESIPIDADIIRWGGDEFIIAPRHSLNLMAIARRALEEINKPYRIGEHELYCTAGIGVAPATISDLENAFDAADIAMYLAKANDVERVGRIQMWDGLTAQKITRERTIEFELPRAIASDFWLAYQPIVRLSDRAIVGAEALARWEFPPGEFIPIAERTGLTFAIFRWVADKAIAQLSDWRRRGLVDQDFWISINVAPDDVVRQAFIPELERLLDKYAIAPAQVGIEITERGVAENLVRFNEVLDKLNNLRFGLKWDDFGSGDHGLYELIYSRFDALKLDKRLQVNLKAAMHVQRRQESLLEAIALLAQKLNLETIAEGVETPEQLAIIERYGIQFVQGYLFHRPMRADALEALLG